MACPQCFLNRFSAIAVGSGEFGFEIVNRSASHVRPGDESKSLVGATHLRTDAGAMTLYLRTIALTSSTALMWYPDSRA